MAMSITTIAPFAPARPWCGGVVSGLAICANGAATTGAGATDAGRFSVLDPVAGTQQAYQMTGAASHTLGYGKWGDVHGGGVVCAFSNSASSSLVQLVRMYTDGSYDLLPTTGTSMLSPEVVTVGSRFWLFSSHPTTTNAPRVYDITTGSMVTTSMAAVAGGAQSVYLGGALYHWATTTGILYKYDATTFTRTTVTTLGFSVGSQAVVIGTKAYWVDNTKVIELESSTDTVTQYTTGVTFNSSLTLGADGRLYGASSASLTAINSWDPATLGSTSDSTGVSGLSQHQMAFTASSKLCFPAAS